MDNAIDKRNSLTASIRTASTDDLGLSTSCRSRRESVCSTTSVPQSPRSRSRPPVSFSTIEIRQYERILGDNPSSQSGPSLSIGWNYDKNKTIVKNIDDYEDECQARENDNERAQRQTKSGRMLLQRHEREEILKSLGYSRAEMASAIRQNNRCKSRRRQTVNNLNMMSFELAIENVLSFPKYAVKGCKSDSYVLGSVVVGAAPTTSPPIPQTPS